MKVFKRKIEETKPGKSNKKYTFQLIKEIKDTVSKIKYMSFKNVIWVRANCFYPFKSF